jgi:hypothetical protein
MMPGNKVVDLNLTSVFCAAGVLLHMKAARYGRITTCRPKRVMPIALSAVLVPQPKRGSWG